MRTNVDDSSAISASIILLAAAAQFSLETCNVLRADFILASKARYSHRAGAAPEEKNCCCLYLCPSLDTTALDSNPLRARH